MKPLSNQKLVESRIGQGPERLLGRRWYILFIYCGLACWNQAITFSYAPVSVQASAFYGFPQKNEVMFWFASLSFVCYALVAIPTSHLVNRLGLRFTVILGATLQAMGALMRVEFSGLSQTELFYLALIGQVALVCRSMELTPVPEDEVLLNRNIECEGQHSPSGCSASSGEAMKAT